MLSVKFKKDSSAIFMSHIDMQRAINRTIKRAGFIQEYSTGYIPHTLLKLSSPIPLGLRSAAEYFTTSLKVDEPEEFLSRCTKCAPNGLEFIQMWNTKENPNFAFKIVASEYYVKSDNISTSLQNDLKQVLEEDLLVVARDGSYKNAKDSIFAIDAGSDGFFVKLASGNVTLRVDKFLEAVNVKLKVNFKLKDTIKVSAFFKTDKFVCVDEILSADAI